MYTDLVNKYVGLMDKIYSTSTMKYCNELNKLLYDKQDKFSLILSEDLNKYSNIFIKRCLVINIKTKGSIERNGWGINCSYNSSAKTE